MSKEPTQLPVIPLQIKTPWNATKYPKDDEINLQPSETIPDQSMSINDIMRRFASGIPTDNGRIPVYDGGEDDYFEGIDIKSMDMSEIQEIRENIRDYIETTQTKLKSPRKSPQAPQATIQSPNPMEIPAPVRPLE